MTLEGHTIQIPDIRPAMHFGIKAEEILESSYFFKEAVFDIGVLRNNSTWQSFDGGNSLLGKFVDVHTDLIYQFGFYDYEDWYVDTIADRSDITVFRLAIGREDYKGDQHWLELELDINPFSYKCITDRYQFPGNHLKEPTTNARMSYTKLFDKGLDDQLDYESFNIIEALMDIDDNESRTLALNEMLRFIRGYLGIKRLGDHSLN